MPTKTSATASQFLDRQGQSGLVTPQFLKQARGQVPPDGQADSSAEEFAGALIKQQVITKYHAKRLLADKTDGFFIGKYRILDLLGSGGMGQVFLAEQTTMKRPVALKLLPLKSPAGSSGLARFTREARAVAKLRHPNITQAYDFDQVDNRHYFAMEYVEGLNFQELVNKAGPINFAEAAHMIAQAALGLDHARQHNMVHRDIKPGNLMVEPNGVVKLLDLGLVVTLAAGQKDSLTLSEKDVVLGTADYIAPEQAINSHDVDIRADIYSLGGVLYFLLTGKAPFEGQSIAQKLLSHQTKNPKAVRERAPDVPEGMAAILAKMMAKEQAERFQKPREVAEALKKFAKSPRKFSASWITYPRETVEKYLRFGGMAPSSSSVVLPRVAPTSSDSPETDKPISASATQVLDEKKEQPKTKRRGDLGAPPKSTKRRRKKKKSKAPMWLLIGSLCLLSAGGAALAAFGVFSSDEEEVPPVQAYSPVDNRLPLKATLGPDADKTSLPEAVRRARRNGKLSLQPRGGGWKISDLAVNGDKLRNGGQFEIVGRGEVVLKRGNTRPIMRLMNTQGLTLENLIFDGGGKAGPVLEITGKSPGLTLKNVTFRNCPGDCVRVINAVGEPGRPIRFSSCKFLKPSGWGSCSPIEIRAGEENRVTRHLEILGTTFNKVGHAVLVGQPVENLRVEECSFVGGALGVKFARLPTLPDEKGVLGVTQWKVAGWRELDADPGFAPRPNDGPQSRPWKWKSVTARNDARVLTDEALGKRPDAVAYGYAEFRSDTQGQRRIYVGADDEVTIWVNGRESFSHKGHQWLMPRAFSGVAHFNKGLNRIWVRLVNGRNTSGFSLHVAGGYVPITDAKYQNVSIRKNIFESVSKPVVFADPPEAGSRVAIEGNRFTQSQHFPIMVRRGGVPFRQETVTTSGNTEPNFNARERAMNKDDAAFDLLKLD